MDLFTGSHRHFSQPTQSNQPVSMALAEQSEARSRTHAVARGPPRATIQQQMEVLADADLLQLSLVCERFSQLQDRSI
jgi:hypothetical protein